MLLQSNLKHRINVIRLKIDCLITKTNWHPTIIFICLIAAIAMLSFPIWLRFIHPFMGLCDSTLPVVKELKPLTSRQSPISGNRDTFHKSTCNPLTRLHTIPHPPLWLSIQGAICFILLNPRFSTKTKTKIPL